MRIDEGACVCLYTCACRYVHSCMSVIDGIFYAGYQYLIQECIVQCDQQLIVIYAFGELAIMRNVDWKLVS